MSAEVHLGSYQISLFAEFVYSFLQLFIFAIMLSVSMEVFYAVVIMEYQNTQRCILNPIKHISWSFLQK